MRSLLRLFALVFVLVMLASLAAAAAPSKISKSINGFYLGESKQALMERAKAQGVASEAKGKIKSQLFPESYVFKGALDKSDNVDHVIVSFYKDHVGQLDVYFVENSEQQYTQAAHGLFQSWNSFEGFNGQTFGPSYIVTLPEVLITLVKAKDGTHVSYIHRELMRSFNDERNKDVAKK
jgi:hypothetical protein